MTSLRDELIENIQKRDQENARQNNDYRAKTDAMFSTATDVLGGVGISEVDFCINLSLFNGKLVQAQIIPRGFETRHPSYEYYDPWSNSIHVYINPERHEFCDTRGDRDDDAYTKMRQKLTDPQLWNALPELETPALETPAVDEPAPTPSLAEQLTQLLYQLHLDWHG